MSALIDTWSAPSLLELGAWSLRWGIVIALVGVGLTVWPPRRVAVRLLLCRVVLVGGLLLPLLPRVWGPTLDSALPLESAHAVSVQQTVQLPSEPDEPGVATLAAPLAPQRTSRSAPLVPATSVEKNDLIRQAATGPLAARPVLAPVVFLLWLVSVALLIGRLLAGAIWLARLRRSARPAGQTALELLNQCRSALSVRRKPALLVHPAVRAPVLLGGPRPAILIPPNWDKLPVECRRAALVHELTHLANRDDWARVVEEIVRAFFFFHPLVHWLLNRLDGEREGLCDTAVVRQGMAPRQLAQVLLDFASRLGAGQRLLVPGMALPFLNRLTVRDRIHQLLQDDTTRWSMPLSRRWRALLAIAMLGLMGTFGSFGSRANPPEKATKGRTSPPTHQDASLPAADPSSVTLRGTVLDAKARPIAGARVKIATAAPRTGQALFCPSCYLDCAKSTRTDDGGRFAIGDLDPTLKFTVLVSATNMKAHHTKLVDPLLEGVKVVLETLPTNVPPERTVLGQLVDDGGQAVGGAFVNPCGYETANRRGGGYLKNVDPTVSDTDGHFRLFLPEGYLALDIDVTAHGYAGTRAAQLKPGAALHRILVPAGTRVTGRLIHAGRPMSGLRIAVVQVDRGARHHFIKAVRGVTDPAGRFAFDYLPANEEYAIFTPVGEGPQKFVLTTKRFTAYGDGKERNLGDLPVVAPKRLAGRVEVALGQALPPDAKIALGRSPAWDLIAVPVAKDGQFVIEGLPPETYEVRVAAKGLMIDGARLPYQQLPYHSFGLRLRESIEDLHIPLIKGD